MSTTRSVSTGVLIALAVTLAPALPSPAVADTAHPRLLFDAADVPTLRQRITSGVPAQAWDKLQFKADSYLLTVQPELVGTLYNSQNQMPSYLIDLSLAYLLSDDEAYGRRAVDLLLALADEGWPVWISGDGVSTELGSGDLSRGVALAFDWTYDLMTPAERALIVSSLVDELPVFASDGEPADEILFACLDPDWPRRVWLNNWIGVCGGGTGLLLLAIEGEPGTGDLSGFATRARNLTMQHIAGHPYPDRVTYGSGGDGSEGHVYTGYGLKNAIPFALAWQRSRGENLLAVNTGLANIPVWLAFEQLPGQGSRFVPRNDAVTPGLFMHELGPMLFELRPGDGVAGWLWDHTAGPDGDDIFATPYPPLTNLYVDPVKHPDEQWAHIFAHYAPEAFTILYYRSSQERPRTNPAEVARLSRHYPEHGLVNFRTGFSGGADEVVATYEARRNAYGHVQHDLGHFNLYGYGARFALDSAYTNTGTLNNGHAIGHSVPIVDEDRFTVQSGGYQLTDETIPLFLDGANLTFVRSDLRAAYAPQAPDSVPVAGRNVLFSRAAGEPVVLAISDTLQRSASPHQYRWQVHTDGTHVFLPTGQTTFLSVAPNGAAMAGAVGDANDPTLVLAHPWEKPAYQVDNPVLHTLVSSRDLLLARRPRLDHLAVLAVTPPGTLPATTATLTADGGTALSVSWSGGEMLVASAAHDSDGVTGRLALTGSFGKVTLGRGETVLDEGTALAAGGIDYVTTSAPASVVVSGHEVVASGPGGTTYRVFAPQTVTSVTVNGSPVAFTRDGDHITFG